MQTLKGKINQIEQFVNPFADNSDRPSDVNVILDDKYRVPAGSIGIVKGNVLFIQNAPVATVGNLSNMNGYHIIDDIGLDGSGRYARFYLTTGKPIYGNGALENILKGADITIQANPKMVEPVASMPGWTKTAKSATDAMKQAAGKVENCRRIYKWIKEEIEPTANILIKETWRMQDFKNIIGDLEDWRWYSEGAYNRCEGLRTSGSGYWKQYELQKISDVYKKAAGAMKAAEEDFLNKEKRIKDWMKLTGMEKAFQGAKTIALAPLRLIIQTVIEYNAKGVGQAVYELKKQNPAKYELKRTDWRNLGGNTTTFDKFVIKGGTRGSETNFIGNAEGGGDEYTGEYFKLPAGIGTSAATAVEGFLAVVATPATATAALPYTAAAAAAIDGFAIVINEAKIKKPKKKTEEVNNPSDAPPGDPGLTPEGGLFGGAPMTPGQKTFAWVGGAFVVAAITTYIFREPIKKIFKGK